MATIYHLHDGNQRLLPIRCRGYVFDGFCLSVCVLNISKSYEQILTNFMKSWSVMGRGRIDWILVAIRFFRGSFPSQDSLPLADRA